MSLPAVLFPIPALTFLSRGTAPTPIEVVAVLSAIGLVGLYFTVKHLLLWANERIVLSDEEIVWYDWLNRERVRSPIGGITPGSLRGNVAFTVGVNGRAPIQKDWRLGTGSGDVRFRSTISDYSDLLRELERRGALSVVAGPGGAIVPGPNSHYRLICNYHTWQIVLGAFVGLGLACGASVAAYMGLTGQAIDANTGRPEPPWFGLAFGAAA